MMMNLSMGVSGDDLVATVFSPALEPPWRQRQKEQMRGTTAVETQTLQSSAPSAPKIRIVHPYSHTVLVFPAPGSAPIRLPTAPLEVVLVVLDAAHAALSLYHLNHQNMRMERMSEDVFSATCVSGTRRRKPGRLSSIILPSW